MKNLLQKLFYAVLIILGIFAVLYFVGLGLFYFYPEFYESNQ